MKNTEWIKYWLVSLLSSAHSDTMSCSCAMVTTVSRSVLGKSTLTTTNSSWSACPRWPAVTPAWQAVSRRLGVGLIGRWRMTSVRVRPVRYRTRVALLGSRLLLMIACDSVLLVVDGLYTNRYTTWIRDNKSSKKRRSSYFRTLDCYLKVGCYLDRCYQKDKFVYFIPHMHPSFKCVRFIATPAIKLSWQTRLFWLALP